MKKILLTLIFTTAYLQSDYLSHPKADLLINELVNEHGFEENFVKEVLSVAEKETEKSLIQSQSLQSSHGPGIGIRSFL